MQADQKYVKLAQDILDSGYDRPDRTGVGTYSLFGPQLEFNLGYGFPALTTKKLYFQSVVRELQWMLSGSTNVKDLHPCHIWDEWADENGDLGPTYGKQWRDWSESSGKGCHIDQITDVIEGIKRDPYGRRHIVSAWNVRDVPRMRLPPCHIMFQFYVDSQGRLSCKMYQRSADYFLGVPFNIAQYALLTHVVAELTEMIPYELIISFGDVHIYKNHVDLIEKQILRTPFESPRLGFDMRFGSIDEFVKLPSHSVVLHGYKSHGPLRGGIAV